MALHIILADAAATSPLQTILEWTWVVLAVAIGLGAVIFVHELGHFLVAKACGVKCEKFYIGFDIGGYKLARFKWGETEYGVGILPLGGYVKMLGQDDNPAGIAEETRRSRMPVQPAEPPDSGGAASGGIAPDGGAPSGSSGEPSYTIDPRSYQAKSVPQRMAIISAGVIMNVIFAFVFATIAYGMGVDFAPSVVAGVMPGSPAWVANVQVGDHIEEIGGVKQPRFRDLTSSVSLGDMKNGVPLVIKRPGVQKPIPLTLVPEQIGGLPKIGVAPPRSLELLEDYPTLEGSPAALATPAFEAEDRIVAVDGQPVAEYHEWTRILAQKVDQPLKVTVERVRKPAKTDDNAVRDLVTILVAANPLKRLGLQMELGPILAIQKDSPAAAAGLKSGDMLVTLNDEPIDDPMLLGDTLRAAAAAGETVVLGVRRKGAKEDSPLESVSVTPRVPTYIALAGTGTPLDLIPIGAAVRVRSVVRRVMPGGAAEAAGVKPGDVITKAEFVFAKGDDSPLAKGLAGLTLEMADDNDNWTALLEQVQYLPPTAKVELTLQSAGAERTLDVTPAVQEGFYSPDRGFAFEPLLEKRTAKSFGEAVALGSAETLDSLSMVFRFIDKLFERQISPRMLGGPITIAQAAGYSAFAGVSALLIFLTMLSANLAVINFLPIPLLDGGHMVFLVLEGILRRPVSEKVVIAFHTVGFVLLISLMLFVLSLDIGIIPRGL